MATRKTSTEPSKADLIQQLLRQNEILLKELQKESAPASRVQKSETPQAFPQHIGEKLRVGVRTYGLHLAVTEFERTFGSAFNVKLKDARGNVYTWRSTSRDVILEVGQRVVVDMTPKEIDGNQIEIGYGKIRKDGDPVGPKRRRAASSR